MRFIRRVKLDSFLSFAPESEPLDLNALNVLIGPNGSGKSNLIEVFELLRATPTNFAQAVRDGGGAEEWLWKGSDEARPAELDVELDGENTPYRRPLRYRLEFTSAQRRVEILDEALEEVTPQGDHTDVYFYYRFQEGEPIINEIDLDVSKPDQKRQRHLKREELPPDQSVLSRFRDSDRFPEITWLGGQFEKIQTFREWTFGRYAPLRMPQRADLPDDRLEVASGSLNLALMLNHIQHRDGQRFDELLKRFFPRYERMSTFVSGGLVQFYLHETGFQAPIPSTRLSDGTLRFVALLAILLSPSPPPLACIEEPELGLHPDAVALLADLLVEASERMQLIVTTHSDALLTALTKQPEAIIACERPGAATVLRRLDPERLKSMLDESSLGDLWREGELGANP